LLHATLYRKPKILVLDEGTANLDERNEELIADLIEQMPITRIVIAHRPALLRRATRVLSVSGRRLTPVKIDGAALDTIRQVQR
jgi:ATP-binding cassette subfamily B protein RaxB